jgi:hypothetical protein
MALAAGGQFISTAPSLHTRRNIEVIGLFLGARLSLGEIAAERWSVTVAV